MTTTPKPASATLDGAHLSTRDALQNALTTHSRGDGELVLWSLAGSDHGNKIEELPPDGVEVQAPRIGDAGTAEMATVALVIEGPSGWQLAEPVRP